MITAVVEMSKTGVGGEAQQRVIDEGACLWTKFSQARFLSRARSRTKDSGRVYEAQPLCATAGACKAKYNGQDFRASLMARHQGESAGHEGRARLLGESAGHDSRARLLGGSQGTGQASGQASGRVCGPESRDRASFGPGIRASMRAVKQGEVPGPDSRARLHPGRRTRCQGQCTCGATAGLSEADKSRASVRYIDSLPRGCQYAVLVHA
jgi:hypothetical protein